MTNAPHLQIHVVSSEAARGEPALFSALLLVTLATNAQDRLMLAVDHVNIHALYESFTDGCGRLTPVRPSTLGVFRALTHLLQAQTLQPSDAHQPVVDGLTRVCTVLDAYAAVFDTPCDACGEVLSAKDGHMPPIHLRMHRGLPQAVGNEQQGGGRKYAFRHESCVI